jgi:hypothetical protein
MDDIKISIPILRKYMKEVNAAATEMFLRYINRRQLSAATGIKYRRLCRAFLSSIYLLPIVITYVKSDRYTIKSNFNYSLQLFHTKKINCKTYSKAPHQMMIVYTENPIKSRWLNARRSKCTDT